MDAKIALLSNVNMNFVIRSLKKDVQIYETEGYGNELGILLDPASSYHYFAPDYTFLLMDLMELIEHTLDPGEAQTRMDSWFATLEHCLKEDRVYYLSDAYLWGPELNVLQDTTIKSTLEQLWLDRVAGLYERHGNLRIFPLKSLVEKMGEEAAFSPKMWYMGKILLTNDAQKKVCQTILQCVERETSTARKVLVLDLDNTLWGGLAGETDHTPLALSEDHAGLAYKNLQRTILQMQKQGVLLAIVSKNNPEDALEVIRNHPHMVLREECFAAKRINWQPKHENILEIAGELNLGTDSFVFWDDNPTERALIRETMPEVAVPDFPDKPEELASAMAQIYQTCFAKPRLTREDMDKTKAYAANAQRASLQAGAVDFESYLQQLQTEIHREDALSNCDRALQLANKTNQFNLTTNRYTLPQLQEILQSEEKRTYLYRVTDRFGDNGLVALLIVDLTEIPCIEEFAMSCRVMGRRVENAILLDVMQDLARTGVKELMGVYRPTPRNKPVANLYEQLGFSLLEETSEGEKTYRILLKEGASEEV